MAWSYDKSDQRCSLKTTSAEVSDLEYAKYSVAGFADKNAFQGRSSVCPYTNDTMQVDSHGMQYHVLCETDKSGDGFVSSEPGTQYTPFHADTMLECLDWCSYNDPLCYGVAYAGSLDDGYRNCFPKQANISNEAVVPNSKFTLATATLPNTNSTCVPGIYRGHNGVSFNMTCDTRGYGTDVNRIHTENFGACMDKCADYEPEAKDRYLKCSSVSYEPSSHTGYLNCHLKGPLFKATADDDWRIAEVTELEGKSKSSAWIAGVVVGAIAGLVVLGGLVWFWRRRSRKTVRALSDDTAQAPGDEVVGGIRWSQYNNKSELDSDHTSSHLLSQRPSETPQAAELPAYKEQGE
jgi:hypothetical protein